MKFLLSLSLILLACYGGYTLYKGNQKTADKSAKVGMKYAGKVAKKTFDVLSSAASAGVKEVSK
jgi:hypothetical protein